MCHFGVVTERRHPNYSMPTFLIAFILFTKLVTPLDNDDDVEKVPGIVQRIISVYKVSHNFITSTLEIKKKHALFYILNDVIRKIRIRSTCEIPF